MEDEFKTLYAHEDVDPMRLEPLVGLAAHLVRRHSMAPAARILLDAVLIDDRSPHLQRHPLRQVQDLVRKFHPALEPNESPRRVIATEAARWIDSRSTDPAAWVAYSAVSGELLSFKRDGSHMSPASGRELVLIDTVLEPAEMQAVYEEVWPPILERLRDAPTTARRALVDVLSSWLRIGRGLDQPYGRAHDEDSIAKAADLARALLNDLVPLTYSQPGLQAALMNVLHRHDIEAPLPPDELRDLFLTEVPREEPRREAMGKRREKIDQLVVTWTAEPMDVVLERLIWLKEQCVLAGAKWPDRVRLAFNTLAQHLEVQQLPGWVNAVLDHELFPEASVLLEHAVEKGIFSIEALQRCLSAPTARWSAVNAVLVCTNASAELVSHMIDALEVGDYRVLKTVLFDDVMPERRRCGVLTSSAVNVRGTAALAMFETNLPETNWLAGSVESCWLAAIEEIDFNGIEPVADDVLHALAELLAARRPETLYRVFERELRLLVQGVESWARHGLLGWLHVLPAELKTRMLREHGESSVRWALLRNLPSNDVMWLDAVLREGLMTPAEALKSKDGLVGPEPTIVDLAKLLVPRGVPAGVIAYQAFFGVHFGEESDHLAGLVEQFENLAESADSSVAAVGRAGLDIFTRDHAIALRKERRQRIRGY